VSVNPQGPRSYDGPDGAALTISVPPPMQAQTQPPAAAPPAAGPGRNTVTIIDGSTGKRQEVPIPASQETRAPAEQRLLESSRHGAIPRIAPDGVRPAEAYARPAAASTGRKGGPRIAIVLTGLGVSANFTRQAIEQLPGPVTLAFQPYGADVERNVASARAQGHEVLLQTPMEPFDYPDNDPGPQTLLTSLAPDQNMDRLYWLMSRFQGYVGIVNYMGGRFTSTEQALAPVLREAAKRGLIYVDDGSSPRSLAPQIAGANNLPFLDSVRPRHTSTGRWRGSKRRRANAVRWSASPRPRPPRSSASRSGPAPPKAAASCWCRSASWRTSRSRAEIDCAGSGKRPVKRGTLNSPTATFQLFHSHAPLRRPALSSLRRTLRDQPQGPRVHRPARQRTRAHRRNRCEKPYPAALRELCEETNIKSVEKLGDIRNWLTYDIPKKLGTKAWKGKYRGQKQKWYALRFTGKDSEIDIANPGGGHDPEFIDWRWEPMENLPELVVPFKRDIYEQVVKAFAKFTK
jgi:polysaccharide deacetylase 2 family uncharacterized protein YibQ